MKSFFAELFMFASLTIGLQVNQAVAKEVGNQSAIVQTNFVDRWITNTAEVQMQVNRL